MITVMPAKRTAQVDCDVVIGQRVAVRGSSEAIATQNLSNLSTSSKKGSLTCTECQHRLAGSSAI